MEIKSAVIEGRWLLNETWGSLIPLGPDGVISAFKSTTSGMILIIFWYSQCSAEKNFFFYSFILRNPTKPSRIHFFSGHPPPPPKVKNFKLIQKIILRKGWRTFSKGIIKGKKFQNSLNNFLTGFGIYKQKKK